MTDKAKVNIEIDNYMLANPRQEGQIGYYTDVAQRFGVHSEKIRKRWRMLQDKELKEKAPLASPTIPYVFSIPSNTVFTQPDYTVTTTNTGTVYIGETQEEITTLEDLVRICNVNLSKFTITTYSITTNMRIVKVYGENKSVQMYAFKVHLKPKTIDNDLTQQKELILAEMKAASTPYVNVETEVEIHPYVSIAVDERKIRNHAFEINIPDLHIGKLAWAEESGEDYDIDIACERYTKAVKDLVKRVNPYIIEKIILPVGNDLINVDNGNNTTTAGTHVSCDSRFGKMFKAARKLLIETIDYLSHIAPVHVEIVPGNHDRIVTFTLGEVLDAWYHNNDRVTVSNTHTARKYIKYGETLIMYTHGDREKLQDLGRICAAEQRQLWAETKYHRVHVGHFHHSKQMNFTDVQEFTGFTVKILNSLSSNDAWHSEQGYLSLKGAEAFLYDKDNGLVANYYYLHN